MSSLPIHQDGTCNGLQHYAALGGDSVGAQQVNLVPGERPGDIYTHIATKAARAIDLDAQNGDIIAQKLQGHVVRKVVKQTVRVRTFPNMFSFD